MAENFVIFDSLFYIPYDH